MILELSAVPEGAHFHRRGLPHFSTGVVEWLPDTVHAYQAGMTAGRPCKRGSGSREVWPDTPTVVQGRKVPGPSTVSDRWLVEIADADVPTEQMELGL